MKRLTSLFITGMSIPIILASCSEEGNIYKEYPKNQEQDKEYTSILGNNMPSSLTPYEKMLRKFNKDSPKWNAVKNTQEKKASGLEVYKIEMKTDVIKEDFQVPCYHTIKDGDTVSEIAQTYNKAHPYYFALTEDGLMNMNHFIKDKHYIHPDMDPIKLRWGCD